MSITIFKAGRMIGPLDRESVIEMLSRREVSEHDLAQRDGVEAWVPLRQIFPPPAKPTRIAMVRDRVREWALKFWRLLHVDPLRVGLASLLTACILLIVPRWTFFIFVPALVASVFAGSLLLTRRRYLSGTLLSVGALVFPALFLMAGRDDTHPGSPFQLLASPSIESVAPPKPPELPPPAPAESEPPPTLRGVALPVPVQPTPPPRPVPPI